MCQHGEIKIKHGRAAVVGYDADGKEIHLGISAADRCELKADGTLGELICDGEVEFHDGDKILYEPYHGTFSRFVAKWNFKSHVAVANPHAA